MAEHNELGKKGEEIAMEFLRNKGFEILQHNWTYGKDEIDIIARDNEFLVMVEVKTRSSVHFGEPETFVSLKKQKFIIRAANEYILKTNFMGETRFDIIGIVITPEGHDIRHIPDAFYPY